MEQLVPVLLIGFFVVVSVLYWRGGTIFNKVFMGSKVADRRAEFNRAIAWSSPSPAEDAIAHVRRQLALTEETSLMQFRYTLKATSPTMLAIAYGKRLGEAFVLLVSAVPDDTGHKGLITVPSFLEQDGMPAHVDKMVALRERVMAALRSQGATFS